MTYKFIVNALNPLRYAVRKKKILGKKTGMKLYMYLILWFVLI